MKLHGGQLAFGEIHQEVAQIIILNSGLTPSSIKPQSRLREDLGISGDDGAELFTALDQRFEMDWSGLDVGILFGNEASLGYPFPWHISRNCLAYEPQELSVADLCKALAAGAWPGTPRIPVSRRRLRYMQVVSSVQWVVLASIPLLVFLGWMEG